MESSQEMTLFPLPAPDRELDDKARSRREFFEMQRAWAEYGGLLNQTQAAKIIGCKPATVFGLIERKRVTTVEFLGTTYIPAYCVLNYVPTKGGRPKKKAA